MITQYFLGKTAHAQIFQRLVGGVEQSAQNKRIWQIQTDSERILTEIGDFMVFLAAALVVIMLLWTGIVYLTAGSDEKKLEAAKTRLKWTIVGVVVIMGVGVILATIDGILSSGSVVGPSPGSTPSP